MKLRIYISGPISKGNQKRNRQQAVDAAKTLRELGYAPLTPHYEMFVRGYVRKQSKPEEYEKVLQGDLSWLSVSDAVLRLRGYSYGADMEEAEAKRLGIPVFNSVEDLHKAGLSRGEERFHSWLSRLGRLHDKKQKDYGTDADPFSNVRASSEWKVEPWIGAMVRGTDKIRRLQAFVRRGRLFNESVEDSLMDIAVYAVISLILFKEKQEEKKA